MIIQATYYWILFGIVILLIGGAGYLLGRKKKKKGIESVGIILAIILIVVNKWIFPNVYCVTQCGTVSKQILLVPKKETGDVTLSLGKHCYLINRSQTTLHIETVIYGNINPENSPAKIIEETVPALSMRKINTVALDYFFEPQDKTVYTKQDGEFKYKVSCVN